MSEHPLGPLFHRSPNAERSQVRVKAVVTLLITAGVLAIALWLTPDPQGYGTHTQLGQSRCGWPTQFGIPCPTCGMTTAFSHVVRGQMFRAIQVQPLGAILALGTCLGLFHAVHALWTGRSLRVNWYRTRPRWVVIVGVLTFVGAWGYKILVMRGEAG